MREKLKLEAQVTKIESEKAPELKALASLQFGGFRINNIRVIEKDVLREGELTTKKYVLFPQHKVEKQNGENEYIDIITFGQNEEEGKKIKRVISNMIVKALDDKDKTSKIAKETNFEIEDDLVKAYINPTSNSEKVLGVGVIYYGGLISIKPIFLKEAINSETNEKFNAINFESRADKEGKYNEGLRKKCIEVAMESLEKNREQLNEQDNHEEISNTSNEQEKTKKGKAKKQKQETDIER